jgi:hypothetical protein
MLGSHPCGLFDSLLSCCIILLWKLKPSQVSVSDGRLLILHLRERPLVHEGLHHHGFPLLLWNALVQTGYGDRAQEYYSQLYEKHGLQHCEVYIDIPSHPMFPNGSPWSTWAIGANMYDAMEKPAPMALTTMCSQKLGATAGTHVSLYPIQDSSDPEWKARMDEVGNIFQVHVIDES